MAASTTRVPDRTTSSGPQYQGRLRTNAGIHKEAYFRATTTTGREVHSGLWDILQTENHSNAPAAVSDAMSLWTNFRTSKGMILTDKNLASSIIATEDSQSPFYSPDYNLFEGTLHGFSFHYNPTSVAMNYGVRNDIDPTQYLSGQEVFNSFLSMSPVSFKLIINRVFDMKYINGYTGKLLPGVSLKDFTGRAPDESDIKDIWNKGTMYDVEYLLRVITGFSIQARMAARNMSHDGKTSDVGFITGTPCELHLGQSMRYLGRITSLSIRHVLFNERMVPTFSEVDISFQRIPDVATGSGAVNADVAREVQQKATDAYQAVQRDKPRTWYDPTKPTYINPGGSTPANDPATWNNWRGW